MLLKAAPACSVTNGAGEASLPEGRKGTQTIAPFSSLACRSRRMQKIAKQRGHRRVSEQLMAQPLRGSQWTGTVRNAAATESPASKWVPPAPGVAPTTDHAGGHVANGR